MNDELRYVKIDSGFKDLKRVGDLYNSAFPASERCYTAEQALSVSEQTEGLVMMAVYDGDTMVGFYAMKCAEGYKCLHFLAVDSTIRNKGYGARIMAKLLKDNQDEIVFGTIEKPVPGQEGYEIKSRRRRFYERLGMIVVERSVVLNGVEFLPVTNRTGEAFERYFEIEEKEANRAFGA